MYMLVRKNKIKLYMADVRELRRTIARVDNFLYARHAKLQERKTLLQQVAALREAHARSEAMLIQLAAGQARLLDRLRC